MNKKINTALFVVSATVFNIITMSVILFAGMHLMSILLPEAARESAGQLAFILVFLSAVAGSFLIYNRLIRLISKRIDMSRYFHPLFKSRGRPQT